MLRFIGDPRRRAELNLYAAIFVLGCAIGTILEALDAIDRSRTGDVDRVTALRAELDELQRDASEMAGELRRERERRQAAERVIEEARGERPKPPAEKPPHQSEP
jgi:hypothetical protein